MPAGMNSKKRREEQDTYGRPEIANVAQPTTGKNIASPGSPGTSKRPKKEHHPGIDRNKVGQAGGASIFWNLVIAWRFRHIAWHGDFYTAHRPEPIPLVQLHQRRNEKWLKPILVQNVVKRGC